jgi:hypothetical protein
MLLRNVDVHPQNLHGVTTQKSSLNNDYRKKLNIHTARSGYSVRIYLRRPPGVTVGSEDVLSLRRRFLACFSNSV